MLRSGVTLFILKTKPAAACKSDRRFLIILSYSVADSIRFILANIKTPAMRQIAMSTTHTDQSGTLIHSRPGMETR